MAKEEGIFKLKGTLHGINFYQLDGKTVARKAGGGFNGKAIKNNPSMQRVRENSSEFGHCSKVNRVFRNAVLSLTEGTPFPNFHRHLMPLFTHLKNLDTTSIRGARKVSKGITTQEAQKLFVNFDFTPNCLLNQRLPFDVEIDSETGVFSLTNVQVAHMVLTKGATHLAFRFGVLHIDFDSLEYELCPTPLVLLTKETIENSFELAPKSSTKSYPTTLYVLGLRMYQQQKDTLYLLSAKESVGFWGLGV